MAEAKHSFGADLAERPSGLREEQHASPSALWDAAASTCVSGSDRSASREGEAQGTALQQQKPSSLLATHSSPSVEADAGCASKPHEEVLLEGPSGSSSSEKGALEKARSEESLLSSLADAPSASVAGKERTALEDDDEAADASSLLVRKREALLGGSSCCSARSLGDELQGLIDALAAAGGEKGAHQVHSQLQQLLAERDLYKAAFGAAKEELKVRLLRALQRGSRPCEARP